MDELLCQISNNMNIQNKIISRSHELCYSLYSLFRHHGYSIEFLVKHIYTKGFTDNGIIFFREDTDNHRILENFYLSYCNNFDVLSLKILKHANKKSTKKKILKGSKRIINNTIKIFRKYLPKVFTDTIVDFCDFIYQSLLMNFKYHDISVESLLCSFIFLRIIFPNIISYTIRLKMRTKSLTLLIKQINKVINDNNNNYPNEQRAIKKIIVNILRKNKNPNYCVRKILPMNEYIELGTILLDEIKQNETEYIKLGINSAYLNRAIIQIIFRLHLPKNDTLLRKSKSDVNIKINIALDFKDKRKYKMKPLSNRNLLKST